MMYRLAAVCIGVLQTVAFAASPAEISHLTHSPLSLRLSNRKVVAQKAQPKRAELQADATGQSFRIRGGIEDGGSAELLVIPKGATGKDVLLRVAVQVEKMGPRDEDMWIRRVQVNGKWLKAKWSFKTGSGFYGTPGLYLARFGDSDWTAPINLLKASDGLLSVAIHDKPVPTKMFQSSTAQDIQLVVGPVIVGVVWKTSNKDGLNFNHLDVHLSGLSSVKQELGGLLIGEPPAPSPAPANETDVEALQDSPEQTPDESSQESLAEQPVDPPVENEETPPGEQGALPPSQLLQAVKSDVSVDYDTRRDRLQ